MKWRKILLISLLVITMGVITYMVSNYYNNQFYAQKLIVAIDNNDVEGVSNLLESTTGNLNSKIFLLDIFAKLGESNNYTPLHEACIKGNFKIVKMLVDAGANVNVVEPITKSTPLSSALSNIKEERIRIANLLIERGANVKTETFSIFWSSDLNDDGSINSSKEKDEFDLFVKMVEKGADPSILNREGSSILHIAVSQGNLLVIKYLIETANINVNIRNNSNRTPIMFCRNVDIASYLLEQGADKTIQDSVGKTAYDYAVENGLLNLAELLRP